MPQGATWRSQGWSGGRGSKDATWARAITMKWGEGAGQGRQAWDWLV